MMEYIFKYRKSGSLFWKKRKIIGHKLFENLNKMCLYYKDGLEEIGEWSKYDLILNADFMLAQKKQMEKESGQTIPVEVK